MENACIPRAIGIAEVDASNTYVFSGPPQWWDPTISTIPGHYSDRVDDPRWNGAFAYGWGQGGLPVATLRIAWTSAGGDALLLSWYVQDDPKENAPPTPDTLWVGIQTANGELFIKVSFAGIGVHDAAPTHIGTTPIWTFEAYQRNGATTSNPLDLIALSNNPAWVGNYTRVWRQQKGGDWPWAVNMRIPIKGSATTLDDNDGVKLDLTSPFRLWVYGEQWLNTETPVPFQWPEVLSGGLAEAPYVNNSFAPPAVSAWNTLSCASQTCAGGVSIESSGIRVVDTGINITRNAINTFVLKPTNTGGFPLSKHQIGATIKIANWGSAPSDAGAWELVSVVTPNDLNRDVIPNDGTPASDTADIRQDWDSTPWETAFITGAKRTHQCVYAELWAAGGGTPVTFSRVSAYQNMYFIPNSTHVDSAEINVRGLNARPGNVFLAVRTRGTPDADYDWARQAERAVQLNAHDEGLRHARDLLGPLLGAAHQPSEEVVRRVAEVAQGIDYQHLAQLLPVVQYDVYVPTGQTFRRDGRLCRVHSLAPSFGFFCISSSAVGWANTLRDAFRVDRNLYALPMPKLGKGRVSPVVQGRHAGELRLPPDRIRKIQIRYEVDIEPLHGVVEGIDLRHRAMERVAQRVQVLDEIERRTVRLRGKIPGRDWKDLTARKMGELVARVGVARQRLTGAIYATRRSQEVFEQRLAVLDRFLDVLYGFDAREVDEVILKVFPKRQGAYSDLLALEQKAYNLAALAPSLLERSGELFKAIERTLVLADEGAAALRRMDRDLDLRPFGGLRGDIDIDRVLNERPVPALRLGALDTLRRNAVHFERLRDYSFEIERAAAAIEAISGEEEALHKEFQFDEAAAQFYTERLDKIR